MVIRAQLVSLHESAHAAIKTGCCVGLIAGALSAVASTIAIEPDSVGYIASMTSTAAGIAILVVISIAFGAICGFAIGGMEAAASFSIATIAARRTMSRRAVFVVLGFMCTAANVSFAAIASIALLGIDGVGTLDYIGPTIVVIATAGTTGIFGWAHSLDWPERIDIRESAAPRRDRDSETLRQDGLIDALQSRLHD